MGFKVQTTFHMKLSTTCYNGRALQAGRHRRIPQTQVGATRTSGCRRSPPGGKHFPSWPLVGFTDLTSTVAINNKNGRFSCPRSQSQTFFINLKNFKFIFFLTQLDALGLFEFFKCAESTRSPVWPDRKLLRVESTAGANCSIEPLSPSNYGRLIF